jgi:hypothetical protein
MQAVINGEEHTVSVDEFDYFRSGNTVFSAIQFFGEFSAMGCEGHDRDWLVVDPMGRPTVVTDSMFQRKYIHVSK